MNIWTASIAILAGISIFVARSFSPAPSGTVATEKSAQNEWELQQIKACHSLDGFPSTEGHQPATAWRYPDGRISCAGG